MNDAEPPTAAFARSSASATDAPVSVWVMSPYPSVRAGLRVLLAEDERVRVLGDSALPPSGPVELSSRAAIEVLVVDLPSEEAIDEFLLEAERLPADGFVLLGVPPADHHTLARLGPRPWGYLPREAEAEELGTAVRTVHAGLLAIDPAIAVHLFSAEAARPASPLLETVEGGEELTPREVEVLSLLAEGIPNKTIARRLGISEHTVKFHVGSVLSKLGASSRTEAVRIGARRGLIAL